MSTNRERRKRGTRPDLTKAQFAYLTGDETGVSGWDSYELNSLKAGLGTIFPQSNPKDLWETHKADFLPFFIEEHPGRRPFAWWQWDAPRQADQCSGAFWEGTLPEPRRQVSGSQLVSRGSYVPRYEYGVPIHLGYDEANPPFFESQAAYLQRYGLLISTEQKKLTPKDLEPESIEDILSDFASESEDLG